jgi:hypothetical protein
MSKTLDISYKQ